MKFLDYNKIEEPSKESRKEMYELYKVVFKAKTFSDTKRRNIMTSIVGREVWSWRVVGITKDAINKIIENNYRITSKSSLQRDHYFQSRQETYSAMLTKLYAYDDWWSAVWENDRTILVTKSEHAKKLKNKWEPLDWKLGLFQCAKQAGFSFTMGREGYYIQQNFGSSG